MLTFSTNPEVAEQQMNAIIFYLTAFGYIDGEFDFTEKTFVRIYIRQLVTARAKSAMPDADFAKWVAPAELARLIVFLASPDNGATRGAVIPVYGGS